MPDLTSEQRALLTIWGSIQKAIRDPELRSRPGGVTQYVWEAWKQSYLAQGLQPPKSSLQAMNGLMSRAGAQARAERSLADAVATYGRTGLDQAITGAMIAPDINSRELSQQPLGPSYRVRFTADYVVGGVPVTQHFTWSSGLTVPASTSDLLGQLHEAAAGFGEDYDLGAASNVTVIGISTV